MTVYLAWTSAGVDDLPDQEDLPGPWREIVIAAGGLLFVDSDDSLSQVYHALKWSLPDGTALSVAPLRDPPKSKGLAPGTNRWLRQRLG